MGYSGAWGETDSSKNLKSKSRGSVPLKLQSKWFRPIARGGPFASYLVGNLQQVSSSESSSVLVKR